MVPTHSPGSYRFLSVNGWTEGMSNGIWFCCAPSLPSILPFSLVLMVEGRYRGALTFPLDTAVFYSLL